MTIAALLRALMPAAPLRAWDAAQAARHELQQRYGVQVADIDAILFPPGEPSLGRQLATLIRAQQRHTLIASLRNASGEAFTVTECAQIQALAETLQSATIPASEMRDRIARLGLNQPGRLALPGPEWLDVSIAEDGGLSKVGVVGERCVALYRLLADRIPAERRQALGRRQPKYHMRAIRYTATLVNGAYGWYRLRPLKPADVVGHVQRASERAPGTYSEAHTK